MSLEDLIKSAEKRRQNEIKPQAKPTTTTPQKTRFNSRPYER